MHEFGLFFKTHTDKSSIRPISGEFEVITQQQVDDVVAVEKITQQNVNETSTQNNKSELTELQTECMVSYGVYFKFDKYLELKYSNNPELKYQNRQSEIDQVFMVGITQCMNDLQTTTSSTSLLFDGKKPRKDTLHKLARIATILQNLDEYPNFRRSQLIKVIKGIIKGDIRTEKKYLKCIEDYSIPNTQSGKFNVRSFYKLMPASVFYQISEEEIH